MDGSHRCIECKRLFGRFADLRKHVKKFHPEKLEIIAPLKKKSYPFQCSVCQKNFSHKYHFNSHLKTHVVPEIKSETPKRTVSLKSQKFGRKCPICNFGAKFTCDFYKHFRTEHDIVLEIDRWIFLSEKNFQSWLSKTEKETQAKFLLKKCVTSSKGTLRNYVCHRSGFFKSKSTGKYNLKIQGSRKINGFCPAGLKVSVDNNSGKHKVTFVKTHIGHERDLCHLVLSNKQRKMLAAQIAQKIPLDVILDGFRENVSERSLERLHMLTKKDLFNIKASFNLHSLLQQHSNDGISVDAWVQEMRSTYVLLYKPQDIILENYPQLKKEDFLLIIMTDGQKTILQTFSEGCICVDRTHELNKYNFELHTLLVLNELRQGFPCAFCISNRSDEDIMKIFFSFIKLQVGPVTAKVFMSDVADVYYNAWKQVMQEVQYRLFCSWHVDRVWREKINIIKSEEKQVAVYKSLRTLMQQTDPNVFEKMIKNFERQLGNDPDTAEFSKYFKNNYIKNVKNWAYCHGIPCRLNTNMHIERLHKTIKYIYLHGKYARKNVQRLDKALGALMKLVKDHLFDKVMTLNKGQIGTKLKEIRKRHNMSENIGETATVKISDGIWQVPSTTSSKVYTIVENINSHCGECQLICYDCQACIHKYSCECIDSTIHWNMCKHIHLMCKHLKANEDLHSEVGDNDELEIVENSRVEESQVLLGSLRPGKDSNKLLSLSDKKRRLIEKMIECINNIQNDTEIEFVHETLTKIPPTLIALRTKVKPPPFKKKVLLHNKKKLRQRRLFST